MTHAQHTHVKPKKNVNLWKASMRISQPMFPLKLPTHNSMVYTNNGHVPCQVELLKSPVKLGNIIVLMANQGFTRISQLKTRVKWEPSNFLKMMNRNPWGLCACPSHPSSQHAAFPWDPETVTRLSRTALGRTLSHQPHLGRCQPFPSQGTASLRKAEELLQVN